MPWKNVRYYPSAKTGHVTLIRIPNVQWAVKKQIFKLILDFWFSPRGQVIMYSGEVWKAPRRFKVRPRATLASCDFKLSCKTTTWNNLHSLRNANDDILVFAFPFWFEHCNCIFSLNTFWVNSVLFQTDLDNFKFRWLNWYKAIADKLLSKASPSLLLKQHH